MATQVEFGRSVVSNIRNNTWSVHTYVKLYEEDGKALTEYVNSLIAENNKVKEDYEKLAKEYQSVLDEIEKNS